LRPSKGYKILRNSFDNIPTIETDERELLISAAKSFNKWIKKIEQPTSYEKKDKPGDLYNNDVNSISECKGLLTLSGWTEINKKDWRRPDKKRGMSATFGHVAKNVFYCFTANGHPFEENAAYKPFQILSLLSYNGDFSRCAKELYKRYNTESETKETPQKEQKKQIIIKIDTEQSQYDVQSVGFRINEIASEYTQTKIHDNLEQYKLRDYSFSDKCLIIEHILKSRKNIGAVIIDGYADLAFGNNDEKEATRVGELLMLWTAKYNIHISGVIHQPLSHNFATGHLGRQIEKKAETVISVVKDGEFSTINAMQLRGLDFAPFVFGINDKIIPYLINLESENEGKTNPLNDLTDIDDLPPNYDF